ncbi:SusC/RagA family TonB-linked outer membrane protein [Mucilaginibacter pocheonensis]|uniref:TonB-linked SusC/RagA family outer membrane protein n=1 Tax=Mucilaginibacter pocheonensis TaxID=398050 RepID=A0ABU1TDS2_9SPHI|nr:SusC/RagA family TonB-linked outer membrane protein [Mucilaginibacter pocheonensis]MDR6943551.1 TonB-linked SusC/RagA family outer membrane protein [Mucilaginibacter pocheonensis]
MKLTCTLIIFFGLLIIQTLHAQTRITLNLQSADFRKILSAIERQSSYHFVYSDRKIPTLKKTSINVKNEDILKVLDVVFANSGFTYTELANHLVVIAPDDEIVNIVKVNGRITNQKGEALPAATIKVKGSTAGTPTDNDGRFSFDVPDHSTLIISYVGYQTKEIKLAGNSSVNVQLAEGNILNEVVITTLGIQKDEKKIGYAMSVVSGDLLDKAKESNIAYSLEGRVAGLSINGVNGGPGSSARILLRGVSSFGAGSPLFIINGIPIDNTQRGTANEWGGADYGDGISNINPDDVESLTVLKGQSASALYGARAANGVIVITTKSGKKNSGFGVEFNSNYQTDKAVNTFDYQTEYGQGENGQRPISVNSAVSAGNLGWGEKLDGKPTIQFDGKYYPYSAVKDNIQKFYRTGHSYTNTVAFNGGNETGSFRLSFSNLDNNSIIRNSGLFRKTINVTANRNITDNLAVNLVSNFILESSNLKPNLSDGPLDPNNIQYLAANENQAALSPGYDSSGSEIRWNNDSFVTNPYFAVNKFINKTGRQRLISAMVAKYTFNKWLYAQIRLGYDILYDNRLTITPSGTAYSPGGLGSMDEQSSTKRSELNSDILIGAKHHIIENLLDIDLSGGANIRKNTFEYTRLYGGPFIVPGFYDYSNLSVKNSVYNFKGLETQSAYYTADLSIKSYLTLNTTGRYDSYSTLPSSSRGIYTPSVSASLIFSEFVRIPALDFGKIRFSYAKTSGEPSDVYITSQYYTINNSINGVTAAGFSTSLPNFHLKPFTLTESEVGTQLKLFNGRLGLDVSFFHRKTKNEIITGDLDPSSGYTKRYIATGSTQNNGLEVELNGTPFKTANFTWTPSVNFTFVQNKILQTDGVASSNISFGTYRPLNAATALVKGLPGPQIMANDYLRNSNGQIIFNANGLPIAGPRMPMGSAVPKIYGGLNNSFTYKKLNLSFLIDYRYGNKILSATNYNSIYRGLNKLTLVGREGGVVGDGVTQSGTKNAVVVPAQTYYQSLAQNISALNVLDGSFIKLRQVTFGYSFSKGFLTGSPFEGITISLVGRNLWTIMKHSDNIDPESSFSPDIKYAGIEGASLPPTHTYGININFKLKK